MMSRRVIMECNYVLLLVVLVTIQCVSCYSLEKGAKSDKKNVGWIDEITGPEEPEDIYTKDIYTEDIYTKDVYTEDVYTKDVYTKDIYTEDVYTKDIYTEDVYTKDIYTEDVYTEDVYTDDITDDILSYQGVVDKIIDYAVNGFGQGQVYDHLSWYVDTVGCRLIGSEALENFIEMIYVEATEEGLDNVHKEPVPDIVPWVRSTEYASMLTPRVKTLAILGLGGSVGTNGVELTGTVLVVRSFDELDARSDEVPGKIVVFNQAWVSYSATVAYREYGASRAAKHGAIAALVRSVTPFSIYSPHTGMMSYLPDIDQIPTASITVEDAELIQRLSDRGDVVTVKLFMGAYFSEPVTSHNLVAEIKGSTYPDEVVIVSGHMDSWDVGQGAMDDGAGAFISWQVLANMFTMGLRPKRTIRMVLWTDEEFGGIGAQQYYMDHKSEAANISLVMESDSGTFTPLGIAFTGSDAAKSIMSNIMSLLSSINATTLFDGADGTDIDSFMSIGVPGGSLKTDGEDKYYFYFHHTNADTMTVLDSHQLDLCTAVWASVAYVVADLDYMLPRD